MPTAEFATFDSLHHTEPNSLAFAASHCAVGLLHCLVHRRSRSSLTHSIRRASTRFLPTRRIPTTCSFSLRMRGAYVPRARVRWLFVPLFAALSCSSQSRMGWIVALSSIGRRAYMTFPLLEPSQQRLVDFVTTCAATAETDLPTRSLWLCVDASVAAVQRWRADPCR